MPKARARSTEEVFSTVSKLKRAGGSLVLTVPAAARNMLGLSEGQEMNVSGKVIAEPLASPQKVMKVRRPRYSLDELLEGYDTGAPRTDEEQAWIDAPAAGKEAW